MKAGVITLNSVCNYGTQLQAYATQEKMKEYFNDVVFIDYRRNDTYGRGLLNVYTKGNLLKAPIIIPTMIYWKHRFGEFQKKYLNLTTKKYLTEHDFENFEDCADVYFSGSDQVWNTGWNKGIIPPFYLSFVPEKKPKYSYSSSFGKNELTEDEVKQSKKYIDRFEKITVREESGVEILKKQYNYENAFRILDPTLTMAASFWRNIAPKSKIKGDYILIYNLNRSKEFDEYAKELSKRTGYKLYRLCTRFDQILRNGKSIVIPEIFRFITLVDNAKFVITDSFHATAFAMNLNTEPICIYPNNYANRISEFLDLLNCSDRHLTNYNDFDIINRHVDFDNVNRILDLERTEVDKYLSEIIDKESKI